jgi:hypothetical protein
MQSGAAAALHQVVQRLLLIRPRQFAVKQGAVLV